MTMISPSLSTEEARRILTVERGLTRHGSTVYVVQRHVSRSGMMRHLSLFVQTNGEIRDITSLVAALLNQKMHAEHHALVLWGSGMDMHFHMVYRLSLILFGDGYALTHRTL